MPITRFPDPKSASAEMARLGKLDPVKFMMWRTFGEQGEPQSAPKPGTYDYNPETGELE